MKSVSPEMLGKLQQSPECIRNICILAHVDHGKTSLADALVAQNGIISARMAGKLRFMDSREDEQLRGITMKSSGISLGFTSPTLQKDFLINLIDTPGHVDFSSEVSTAVRLCDGALVVVDVVEGVCPQTFVVLKQAWQENIRPVLVLNKLDRLILEMKLSPLEAYRHIQKVLTDVNAATGELFTSELLARQGETEDRKRADDRDKAETKREEGKENEEEKKTSEEISFEVTSVFDEADDSKLYFSPDQGNVIFASAIDGWGFGLGQFVDIYSKKLGVSARVFRKTLWGDYFLNAKTKKIQKGAAMKAKKPLFVQLVLENLWSVYDAVLTKRDKNLIEKITTSLNLKILPRDSRNADARVHLQAICGQWLPLADAALDMVCRFLPSPLEMSNDKVGRLLGGSAKRFDEFPPEIKELSQHFQSCSADAQQVPTIAFVSKVFAIESSALPSNKKIPLTPEQIEARREEARKAHSEKMRRLQENPEALLDGLNQSTKELVIEKEEEPSEKYAFVALARVYSGCLRKGQRVYVLGPKHDPVASLDAIQTGELKSQLDESEDQELPPSLAPHMSVSTISDVFLLMGRDLELVEAAPAGCVVGIAGLENHVLRSATISTTPICPPFTDIWMGASKPIVRVAVEPKNPSDVGALVKGMKMLNQADPCVQVVLQETGEHVMMTAGEVHLERCVKDLKESYAKVPLNVSSPIVPFRETIVDPPKVDRVNELISNQTMNDVEASEPKMESLTILTPNKEASLEIKLLAIPKEILRVLEVNAAALKLLAKCATDSLKTSEKILVSNFYRDLISSLSTPASDASPEDALTSEDAALWKNLIDSTISFGPKKVGCNMLINDVPGYRDRPSVWPRWAKRERTLQESEGVESDDDDDEDCVRENDHSIVSGFQLATNCGPICNEPLMGVAVILKDWKLGLKSVDATGRSSKENSSKEDSKDLHADDETDGRETDRTAAATAAVSHGPMSGQLMSAMKEGILKSFNQHPRRLMVAMYSCEIQATAEVLGRMYAVLSKRQGRVEGEELREGSNVFIIRAMLPVVESFGFCNEVRKRTSGLASPQLVFSHWEVFDLDPFWVPTTEEEIAHFGEKADSENVARKYMNDVRRRKGLKVEEKIVEFAEKQRTLTKNK